VREGFLIMNATKKDVVLQLMDVKKIFAQGTVDAVSYTHLTLPTSDLV